MQVTVSGKEVLIDNEDFPFFSQHSWYISSNGYVTRTTAVSEGLKDGTRLLFHRELVKPPAGKVVDHINRNKLDNRKENLRVVTQVENTRNQGMRRHNTSGYKGVSWYKRDKLWRVDVCVTLNGIKRQKQIGKFEDKEEAARAYDSYVREHFGPLAYTNFPAQEEVYL